MTVSLLTPKVVDLVQGDVALAHRPFAALAAELGCPEADIIGEIRRLKEHGIMRRFGAVLRHQQAGFVHNAMVAWQAPPEREDEFGLLMASYSQVSHCYRRQVPEDFPYQLFTMIHARSEGELQEVINSIATCTGIDDYLVLNSVREFKKVSMRYKLDAWMPAHHKEEG